MKSPVLSYGEERGDTPSVFSLFPSVLITGPIKAGAGAAKLRPIEDPNTKDQQNYDDFGPHISGCYSVTQTLGMDFYFLSITVRSYLD